MPRPKGRPLPEDHKRRISESVRRSLARRYGGDVMERRGYSPRPWQWLPNEGQFIIDVKGNIVAEVPCQGCNPKDGELIVRAVNEHTTLVEQRDRLAKAAKNVVERLRDLPRFLEKNDSPTLATITAECLADLAVAIPAEDALATVEQGHEELAGGGSEG